MQAKDVLTQADWEQFREQKIADVLAEYDNVNMTNLRLGVAEYLYQTPYGQRMLADRARALTE